MKIQLRHDVAANWTSANPTLSKGEFGVEDDTGLFKIGDGATPWNELAYSASGSGGGLTQSVADARYVKLSQINQNNGVAGLDAAAALDGGNF